MSGNKTIASLQSLLNTSLSNLLAVCEERKQEFPSLDNPLDPSELTPEGIRNDPRVQRETTHAIAAAYQLIATLQSPMVTLVTSLVAFNLPAAIGVAEALNVPEIIRPAGPQGMHVNDIAKVCGANPQKLSHILRSLATQHWFREVAPDTYANNLLSSLFDTGKEATPDLKDLKKHMGTSGLTAFVGLFRDETIKSAGYLTESVTNPKTAHSEEATETSFQLAINTPKTFWDYYNSDDDELARFRGERFNLSMRAYNNAQPPADILNSFDWASIPEDQLLVDVGGGWGHVSLVVAKANPGVRVVIEDREDIRQESKEYWEKNLPSHIQDGKYHFVPANFFDPQPALPGTPGVFLLRIIIHDWSDKYAMKILRRLRDAAAPTTKLVLIGHITELACRVPGESDSDESKAPEPLLANMGGARLYPYLLDLTMMALFNGLERTVQDHRDILRKTGWKLEEVRRNRINKELFSSVISSPI